MRKKESWKFTLTKFWVVLLSMGIFPTEGFSAEPTLQDFQLPFYGLKQQGSTASPKVVPLIVIAWQPKGKGEPMLDRTQLEQLFFGVTDSVAHWFKENSQTRYILNPHPVYPVIGPVDSTYDWPFYWRNSPTYVRDGLCGGPEIYCQAWLDNPYKVPPPVGDPHRYEANGTVYYLDNEGYIGGHTHSWAEAIRRADLLIDFSVYDVNGDGFLSTDECLVIVVKAQASTFGTRRTVVGSDVPKTDLVVDGMVIRDVCELYAAPPHNSGDLAVAVEEVLHLAANLADQYPDGADRLSNDPRRPTQLALTDAGRRPVHIDPYHKLKWGWLNPQLATVSGNYVLRDAATTGDALILYSPYLGTVEFFILENRWRGLSYDRYRSDVYQEGLALWEVRQDTSLNSNWARKAVHLKRADPELTTGGSIKVDMTLFDAGDPDRGYLLSDYSVPQSLMFESGLPSQIRVRVLSTAGPSMTVQVIVPPKPGEIWGEESDVNMIRIHAKGSGYGPPDHMLTEDGIIKLEATPELAYGVDLNNAAGRAMLTLLVDAYKRDKRLSVNYQSKTAIGHSIVRVMRDKNIIQKGDINGNGEVNLIDAVQTLQLLSGVTYQASFEIKADSNRNNRIGMEEVLYILDLTSEEDH